MDGGQVRGDMVDGDQIDTEAGSEHFAAVTPQSRLPMSPGQPPPRPHRACTLDASLFQDLERDARQVRDVTTGRQRNHPAPDREIVRLGRDDLGQNGMTVAYQAAAVSSQLLSIASTSVMRADCPYGGPGNQQPPRRSSAALEPSAPDRYDAPPSLESMNEDTDNSDSDSANDPTSSAQNGGGKSVDQINPFIEATVETIQAMGKTAANAKA